MGYDWQLKDSWAERISAVTAADVRRVARRYLVDDALAVARILPARRGATP
jgi:zinc protease